MGPEETASDVTNGEHGKRVALAFGAEKIEIVDDVDWQEDGASKQCNQGEDGSHHSEETKEDRNIKSNVADNLIFLFVINVGYPFM